jgi:hypothetical protein
MLWTYNRGGRQTSYEVCQAADGSGYELKRRYEDGHVVLERFSTLEQLNHRIQGIEAELVDGGWSLAGTARR